MPSLVLADATGSESSGRLEFVATLSQLADAEVTVRYRTIDGTARGGEDFHPAEAVLTIPPGEASASIFVSVIDDGLSEMTETFRLEIEEIEHAIIDAAVVSGTIADNESETVPALVGVQWNDEAGTFEIGWRGVQRAPYTIQVSDDLLTWRALEGDEGEFLGSGGLQWTRDGTGLAGKRFYRIGIPMTR